jgi:hypothetical protein
MVSKCDWIWRWHSLKSNLQKRIEEIKKEAEEDPEFAEEFNEEINLFEQIISKMDKLEEKKCEHC